MIGIFEVDTLNRLLCIVPHMHCTGRFCALTHPNAPQLALQMVSTVGVDREITVENLLEERNEVEDLVRSDPRVAAADRSEEAAWARCGARRGGCETWHPCVYAHVH